MSSHYAAAKDDPPATQVQALIALYNQGEMAQTERQCRMALQEFPRSVTLLNLLGAAFQTQGKLDFAASAFVKAIALNPKDAQLHNNYGVVLLALSSFDTARACFLKALKLTPDYVEAHNNLGNALRSLGQLDAALTRYNKAIAIQPTYGQAHYNRGVTLQQMQQMTAALASYEDALAVQPEFIEAHINRGVIFQQLGKADDAITSYELALTIDPDHAETHNNMGIIYAGTGDHERAQTYYEKALALKPDYVEGYINLATMLFETGHTAAAIAHLETALGYDANDAMAHNLYGLLKKAQGDVVGALASYATAIAQNPDFAEPHINTGLALQQSGAHASALAAFDRAIKINPDHAEAYNNKAVTLQELGRFDAALASYDQAITLAPDYALAYFNRSNLIKDIAPNDPMLANMERLFADHNTDKNARKKLGFALGAAHEKMAHYDASFRFLQQANDLRKAEGDYHIEDDRALFSMITDSYRHFQRANLKIKNTKTKETIQPILIVGMPRSGTSLAEQILASHPDVHGAGELDILTTLFESLFICPDHQPSPKDMAQRVAAETETIRAQYFRTLTSCADGASFVTDKLPLNFRWIGFIKQMFPEAKIIHLQRDPRAICWSIYKHEFASKGNGFAYDIDDLAAFYRLYANLMGVWHSLLPHDIYELNYERLTQNQEDETRALLAFCDLTWAPQCLEFHKTERAVQTASAVQVRQKLYQGSSDAWRHYEQYLGAWMNLTP
ncbi:tetratricopeptide repeat-containing sulfotransferase family protein [Candidatus Puniceispirillum marinum]|uniref:Putative TPR repeat protein n=1 Tax=Puniceispirillum marinum (strain IMCC1322) TaxID=488538 RepID=D5BU30_PUNMI|nr:tetratricopeptide repeat-containing sulfotransferase family protein [Candidatus Puniceispirillum marinum]ADE39777.1 putative TPR repeat protein [Candidatus Puniceispirillum marinum IMCC1322]